VGLIRRVLKSADRLSRRGSHSRSTGTRSIGRGSSFRMCRFEQMEPRRLLAVGIEPIQVGAVYFEDKSGDDQTGEIIEITWNGGAPGTQLISLTIEGDKLDDGPNGGDAFFDTVLGGLGEYGAVPLSILDSTGIDSVTAVVLADGGSTLTFAFTGFDPGEKLVFTIDVDEHGFNPNFAQDGYGGPNAFIEGKEFEGSLLKATFKAEHYYDAPGQDVFLDDYDPKLQASGLDLPPNDYIPPDAEPRPVQTAGAIFSVTQNPLPVSIAGTVFEDFDLDLVQDGDDLPIENVELALYRVGDQGEEIDTHKRANTDEDGDYLFEGEDLLPGVYKVVETQPEGYLSVGAVAGTVNGETRGFALDFDVITSIELNADEHSIDNDFAETKPVSLSGHVYHDANNDHRFDPDNEDGIGNALIRVPDLMRYPTVMPPMLPLQTRTDDTGFWQFENLFPGEYWIEEVQPGGYLDGFDTAGTVKDVRVGSAHNPGDRMDGVKLISGQSGIDYDFGELKSVSLSGYVYADDDNDGFFDKDGIFGPPEEGIPGVHLALLDADGIPTGKTTVTNADGYYIFEGEDMAPGTYGVDETQPEGYKDGLDTAGTVASIVVGAAHNPGDRIDAVRLPSGQKGINYNFGEIKPSCISGYVYVDANGDLVLNDGDTPLPEVTVHLLNESGKILKSKKTDDEGFYKFCNLEPSTYGVEEVQPEDYFDGIDTAGSAGGTVLQPDSIIDVTLSPGTNATHYDFREILPASLSGYVYVDLSNDGIYNTDTEDPIEGVKLTLLGPTGKTAVTDENGFYIFEGLEPGTYRVQETQPDDYYDGLDTPGNFSGSAELPPGDLISDVSLKGGAKAVEYNFGELPPATLSGYVYVDLSNDGIFDPTETPIEGVKLTLLGPTGKTGVTDENGFYMFEGLELGTYRVQETQPDDYYDGLDTPGNFSGTAELPPGDLISDVLLKGGAKAVEYNFGELPPASISGRVFADIGTRNCFYDSGEPLLGGVTVYLLDAAGNRIKKMVTNDDGEYLFDNLKPGTYGVEEIQPDGYLQGNALPGTVEGEKSGYIEGFDKILAAQLGPGTDGIRYDFCEIVPASISGYVFQDGPSIEVKAFAESPDPATVRDGRRTDDDKPIAGVVLRLGNVAGASVLDADGQEITAVTNLAGYYEFTGLWPGVYTVYEVHPGGFTDSIDSPGTNGGNAFNPHDPPSPDVLIGFTGDHGNDAIMRVKVDAGDAATEYNFSEVRYHTKPPWFPKRDPDPDPKRPNPPMDSPIPRMGYLASPPQIVIRPMFGGSSGPGGYTWHLSVINGGSPRSDPNDSEALTNPANRYFDPITWTGVNPEVSLWMLGDEGGSPRRKVRFGLPGAIPVPGDFNGDGIAEVAVFIDGIWFIDLNGNGHWDEGDLWAKLGEAGDLPVVGDWDGDGKDDIGIFGPAWIGDGKAITAEPGLPEAGNELTGRYKNVPPDPAEAAIGYRSMKRTTQGQVRADLIDHVFKYGSRGDKPVAGDFNGDGIGTIGVFREGTWYLDVDGNGRWSRDDVQAKFGDPGDVPVVGDFNGDGKDDIGVYRAGRWYLDTNNNRRLDALDRVFNMGGPHDKPAVGDFDGDGVDEPAVYQDETPPAAEEMSL